VTQVAPATHEVKAHLFYSAVETHPNAMVDYEELAQYWFVRHLCVDVADGYHETDAEINGEHFEIEFPHSDSGIAPHRDHEIQRDNLREYDIKLRGRGERKVSFNISPRFEGMRDTSGDLMTTAFDHAADDAGVSEGVDVFAQSSNIRVDELPTLLRAALHELAEDLGVSMYQGYFQQPFGGNISQLERYVRYNRQLQEKLIGTGSVMHRLDGHLSTADGTKGERKWDNEGTTGKYHVVRFGTTGANLMVSRHRLGGQLKSYLPEHPEEFEPGDPLFHPKFGALFTAGRTEGGAVDWDDRHDLVQELDERLLSILSWADVPLDGGTTYVADDHFKARAAADPVPLHADPLPELEARDELLLTDALREMTDADEEMARTLVADGGMHVDDLAERHDRGLSTVYRMLDRLDGVLESKNGHVQFVSEHVRHELRAVVESMEDRVRSAAERVSRLVDIDAHQRHASAFDEALARYAAEFDRGADGTPTLRIGARLSRYARTSSDPTVADVLDELLSAWRDDDRDPMLLRQGTFVASVDGDRRERSIAAEIDNGRRRSRPKTPD